MSEYVKIHPWDQSKTTIDLDAAYQDLQKSIPWDSEDPDRKEAMFNRAYVPYQYGKGRGFRRQKFPKEPLMLTYLWSYVEQVVGYRFEVCFANHYLNKDSYIGWHTDASPSIDKNRPVCVLTLGHSRPVGFRPLDLPEKVEFFEPKPGEIVEMVVGTNDRYEHAVLPHDVDGTRISLVFRGIAPFRDNIARDFHLLGYADPDKSYGKPV